MCGPSTATRRSSAARTAGRAPAASITPRASSTGSSTASAATPRSVNSYSLGASEVILPHVVGGADEVLRRATTWKAILEHTELVVAFGGMNVEERVREPGRRRPATRCRRASPPPAARGLDVRAVQPAAQRPPARRRRDVAPGRARHRHRGDARPRPRARHRGSARHRVPRALHASAPTGSSPTCSATSDGQPKTPEWAAAISGIDADDDARPRPPHGRAPHAGHRQLGAAAHPSTASSRCGWASRSPRCSARSACPAAGSATATARWPTSARPRVPYPLPVFEQGRNPVDTYIPVAQITDAAREPRRHPRLRRPRAAAARHPARVLGRRQPLPPPPGPQPAAPRVRPARHRRRARAVLDRHRPPRRHRAADDDDASSATTSARGRNDGYVIAMPRAIEPVGEARDDYEIFAELAKRLDAWDEFTEGRTARDWVEHIYERFREQVGGRGRRRARRSTSSGPRARRACRSSSDDHTLFDRFRADPDGRRLRHAERPHRAVLGDDRRLRLRRLPGPPGVARARGVARRRRGRRRSRCTSSPTSPSSPAARPARRRRAQPGVEGGGPRADPHPPRRRRGPRHRRRRRRARVQRSRRVPAPARS